MENTKKPSRDYYGLKRLIEIGAIASPLVVVFAVSLAPLIAECVSLLISYSNNLVLYKNAALAFAVTGLVVTALACVYVSIQAYYYFTRTRRGRWTLYYFGSFILAALVTAIIINGCMLNSCSPLDSAALRSFTTLLQSFITISLFIIFNMVFMYAWTRHLKNADVPRQPDKMINVVKD